MPQIEVNANPGHMTVAGASPGDVGYIDGELFMILDESDPGSSDFHLVVSLEDGCIYRPESDEIFEPLPSGAVVTLTVE